MRKADVCETIEKIVTPIAKKSNCAVYDIEFVKEGSDYFLRVFIDTASGEGSASLDDCEAISRELSDELDKADPIDKAYMLEVSTPGIDRVLRKDEHFARFIGSKVDIGLYKAIDGAKCLTGTLKGFEDGVVTVELAKGDFSIKLAETTSVRLSLEGLF